MCLFWVGQSGSVGSLGAAHGTPGWVPDGRATATAKLVLVSGDRGREESAWGEGKEKGGGVKRRMHGEKERRVHHERGGERE